MSVTFLQTDIECNDSSFDMAWSNRQFSKGRINRAGDELISLRSYDPRREEALVVINNWRSCHGYPLQAIKMTLLKRARNVDANALIAQRLKRLSSVALKLKDNPNMKLSQMQDIGGCRAILTDAAYVAKLVKIYKTSSIKYKNQPDRPVLVEEYDYIQSPKPDGYRGVHLIYKYQSRYEDKLIFNGQRIEVQIRSRLQHAWATAVETAQAFTGQALKSKFKTASSPEWLRFFALMGAAIAAAEKRPTVPGTPTSEKERTEELRSLADQEKIVECLQSWDATMHRLEKSTRGDEHVFLLLLDPAKRTLRIDPFKANELADAQSRYLQLEKETESDPQIQVVLVSVSSLDALRKAYPNYYVDSSVFIDAVRREIS